MSEIFDVVMDKVKNISKPVKFKEINKKYINIYSKPKNQKQNENNLNIRKDLLKDFLEYAQKSPMFTKLKIYNLQKFEMIKNDKFLYDCELYVYLDANGKEVHKDFKVLNKYENNIQHLKEQKVNEKDENCEINEEGKLVRRSKKKEGINSIFNIFNKNNGERLTIGSILDFICNSFSYIPMPVLTEPLYGGVKLMYEQFEPQEKK